MSQEEKGMIGYDPLAWLQEESDPPAAGAGKEAPADPGEESGGTAPSPTPEAAPEPEAPAVEEALPGPMADGEGEPGRAPAEAVPGDGREYPPDPGAGESEDLPQAGAPIVPDAEHGPEIPGEDHSPSGGVLLDPVLDITEAPSLRSRLLGVLENGGKGAIRLDGSQVEAADTAGIQVLVAFIRDAKNQGREVRWDGASPVLHELAEKGGLGSLLNLEA